jgi:hypothetical protein
VSTQTDPARLRARAKERRLELLAWMSERWQHQGLSTRELAEVSGIYDRLEYKGWLGSPISRATRDVRALQSEGLIRRLPLSRPARWEVV